INTEQLGRNRNTHLRESRGVRTLPGTARILRALARPRARWKRALPGIPDTFLSKRPRICMLVVRSSRTATKSSSQFLVSWCLGGQYGFSAFTTKTPRYQDRESQEI